jgi:hypothetical protein
MNWSKLTKEQKEKLLLLLLVSIGVLYSLMTFIVNPYVRRGQQTRMDLEDMRSQLAQAQRSLSRESQTRGQLDDATRQAQAVLNQCIPPMENPLSWVAQRVYGSARAVGLEIESVNDLGVAPPGWATSGEGTRAFVPYSVRIVTQCGYRQLVNLIQEMEKSNPYLCVTEIAITAQENSLERHRITLGVEWPFWRDAAQAEQFQGQGGTSADG